MKQNIQPTARQKNLVVQDFENEVLIYDLGSNKAFCLNQTSALVWQFSNGRNSVADIADLMSKKMKILVSEEVVWLALDQLKKDNLLENYEEFDINFNGLTRRQVIKKVGLASMIALPLVSSVVAPSAAMAQSGPPCAAPGTIAPNFCSNSDAACNANLRLFGITCCSGMGVSTAQPCSFFAPNLACACG